MTLASRQIWMPGSPFTIEGMFPQSHLENLGQLTFIAFDDRTRALAFEKYLKSHSGRAFSIKRL